MTRRSSTRALAREIYRQAVEKTLTPDPPSPDGFGAQTGLTERVRALYEGSAVPVREIANLAGVTERTIYKYAAKHQWKPRYAWTPHGSRPRAWRAGPNFTPAKGAGGRFIRRDDKDKPFAVGLKATDAPGAARAGKTAASRTPCAPTPPCCGRWSTCGAIATRRPSTRRPNARRPTISFAAPCR
jgi:hypothetical protein